VSMAFLARPFLAHLRFGDFAYEAIVSVAPGKIKFHLVTHDSKLTQIKLKIIMMDSSFSFTGKKSEMHTLKFTIPPLNP
jgi:hypothetical protein